MAKRPPVRLETMAAPWGRGPSAKVDAFSLRPFGDYLRATQQRPTETSDPEPEMFSAGPLPIFCASGIDVEILRFAHWVARHSAAMTADPTLVYSILEASADPDGDPYSLTTPEGRRALAAHSAAVFRWAVAPPPPEPGSAMSVEEYDQIWGAAR